jgi:serine/threonine protein phosphatase PrpC
MKFLLASAARATVGARSGQEDSFRVWPAEGDARPDPESPGMLAVLADGMGGHTGGAIAGQTACAAFTDAFLASATPYAERLNTALHASNDALAREVERNVALRGMGCTLVAAWFDSSGMRWTSVGDSLLLLYRFPEVIRLNADHSLGSLLDEQARQNIITASEAKSHLNRNALRSALTGSHIELIDMHGEPFSIRGGDWIVLASDGLCSLAGDEIADVIGRHRHEAPAAMAEALIDAVLAKGVAGQDNATVVAVRVEAAPGAAVDEVTTRVVLRSARGGATAAKGKEARSLLSSALDVSPAVWLGAAAGLLLIAVVMALTGPPHKRQPAPAVTRPPPESQQIPEVNPPERGALLPSDPAPPQTPPTGGAPPNGQSAEDPSAAGPPSQAAPPQARPSQAARREGPDAKKTKDKRERIPFPTTPN